MADPFRARRLPHERLVVRLATEARETLRAALRAELNASVARLAQTVAGSLAARQGEGEVRRFREVLDAVGDGAENFSGDQVRLMMNLLGTGNRTEAEVAVYLHLRHIWEEGA